MCFNTTIFKIFTIQIIQCVTDKIKLITQRIISLTSTSALLYLLFPILLTILLQKNFQMKVFKSLVCAVITLIAIKKFKDVPSKYRRTKNGAKMTIRAKVMQRAKVTHRAKVTNQVILLLCNSDAPCYFVAVPFDTNPYFLCPNSQSQPNLFLLI